jgi:hypothetical protein
MPRPSKAAIRQGAHNALQRAREAAGRELELPVDDWRVVRLATLTMASDSLQAELALGGRVDFGDLLSVDRQLAELRKELKPANNINLEVHVVGPADEAKCPECGHVFKPPEVRQTLKEAQHAASERIAKESAARAANAVVPQPAETPRSVTDVVPGAGQISTGRTPPPNVVELKRPSIHDPVVFGDGTKLNPPLKRLGPREAWQGYPLPTV